MKKLVTVLAAAGTLAALIAGGVVLAQGKLSVAAVSVRIERQPASGTQPARCAGFVEYLIEDVDAESAAEALPRAATLEVEVPCATADGVAPSASARTATGKLAATRHGVSAVVLLVDPDDDGEVNGPRVAGECDVGVIFRRSYVDAEKRAVLSVADSTLTIPDPTCAGIVTLLGGACVIARGGWPPSLTPPIADCGK